MLCYNIPCVKRDFLLKKTIIMTKEMKLSPHERTVLTLLGKTEKPLTAYAILGELQDKGFRAPPTVYRALESLIKKGLVHRIESLNAYTACSHSEDHGHASPFAICNSCGTVEEIDSEAIARAVKKVAGQFFAQIEKRVLELSGICHSCAKTQRRA